jgi:drug/metabolite transporter (DMT)-like permease
MIGRTAATWPGSAIALGSAVLFGASTPFAKLLLGDGVDPWLLAGLLYLGSGIGLSVVYIGRSRFGGRREPSLQRADLFWLGLVVLAGGIVAPVLLMIGLTSSAASSAALLLNLEGLATMAIAWLVFREHTDRRLVFGALIILAGAVLISWRGGPMIFGPGALAIAAACLAWGVDNNLTRKLSRADPVQITLIKGLVAGSVNLVLALLLGSHLPPLSRLAGAALVGFLGYGLSLVLFVLGLRLLGAARTGAYFSAAPFIGAAISVCMFSEPVTVRLLAAGGLMAIGLYLHLTERHDHLHEHAALDHEHSHVHDIHHRHTHAPSELTAEPHSHRHHHAPMRHRHAHYPDLHHRHDHV